MNSFVSSVISLVGQRNVGKSTLFNRLTQTNIALISKDGLGLTRDRQYGCIKYKKYKSVIIDTGGLNELFNTKIQNHINHQTILAIKESCIVLFIVDGQSAVSSIDHNIAKYLRKLEKKIFVIVNKIDTIVRINITNYMLYDYYILGIKNVIPISAMHGYGIHNLLNQLFLKNLKNFDNYEKSNILKNNINQNLYRKVKHDTLVYKMPQVIKLAIIGRPNSGKSTFINCVSKKNRMITSEIPGTTRDNVHVPILYNNQKYILIDTAGVRRKKNIHNSTTEYMSVLKTLQVLKNSHITLFIIDVNEGIVDQDLSLIRLILNKSTALIIVINKWDNVMISKVRHNIYWSLLKKTSFFNHAKIHFISSLYGNGINVLFKSIRETYQSSIQTISTAQLNRIMYMAIVKNPPPFLLGNQISSKPKYAHIGGYNPITIIIHGAQVSKLSEVYRRYLRQYFYQSLHMQGVSIRLIFKDTVNPFKNTL